MQLREEGGEGWVGGGAGIFWHAESAGQGKGEGGQGSGQRARNSGTEFRQDSPRGAGGTLSILGSRSSFLRCWERASERGREGRWVGEGRVGGARYAS